ncbi:MAG: lipid-binding SYLF domain-containing protein [Planctomycetota bacterium]
MKRIVSTCMFVAVAVFSTTGCATAPRTAEGKAEMNTKVQSAIDSAVESDPGLKKFFDEAAGYAVFPTVGKGAVGVGGAYGRGALYEGGQLEGYCTLTQASIGLALGGQAYTELIFFETKAALDRFKTGNFAFAAQASAVALKSGASANAKYTDGVAVFTMGEAGLMYEASIGGQKFSYEPK